MDLKELSKINKEFADQAAEMSKEFSDLFEKWKKKSLRFSVIMAIHMPINIIMNMLYLDKNNHLPRLVENFPDIFERFLTPFMKIKDQWGKVSSREFTDLYKIEYEKQFDP